MANGYSENENNEANKYGENDIGNLVNVTFKLADGTVKTLNSVLLLSIEDGIYRSIYTIIDPAHGEIKISSDGFTEHPILDKLEIIEPRLQTHKVDAVSYFDFAKLPLEGRTSVINSLKQINEQKCLVKFSYQDPVELTQSKVLLSGKFIFSMENPDKLEVIKVDGSKVVVPFNSISFLEIFTVSSDQDLAIYNANINAAGLTYNDEEFAISPLEKQEVEELALELLKDVSHTNIYRNQKLYDYFAQHPEFILTRVVYMNSTAVFPDNDLQKLREITKQLPINVLAALVHPGISIRIDEFLEFFKLNIDELTQLSTLEIVNKFSNEVDRQAGGPMRLYRGMALDPDQADRFKSNGIPSPNFSTPYAVNRLSSLLNPNYYSSNRVNSIRSIREEVFERLSSPNSESEDPSSALVSLSTYPEVAASVGWHSSNRINDTNAHPYLFEVELPIIELMDPFKMVRRSSDVDIVGKTYSDQANQRVELMYPFQIPISNIVGINRLDKGSVPSFNVKIGRSS